MINVHDARNQMVHDLESRFQDMTDKIGQIKGTDSDSEARRRNYLAEQARLHTEIEELKVAKDDVFADLRDRLSKSIDALSEKVEREPNT
jgi:hypothetical protein